MRRLMIHRCDERQDKLEDRLKAIEECRAKDHRILREIIDVLVATGICTRSRIKDQAVERAVREQTGANKG